MGAASPSDVVRVLAALASARSMHSPRPLLLTMEPSARCNARCAFCYHWREGHSGQVVSTDRWLDLISEARALGCIAVNISGGEPTLLPDLEVMLGRVRATGMSAHLTTNGSLTDVLGKVARLLDSATVSLDSIGASHDSARGYPGLFDAAVRSIHLLRSRGVAVRINMTLGQDNLDDLEAMHGLARDLGALLHVRLMTCEAPLEGIRPLSALQMNEAGERLQVIKRGPGSVLVTPNAYLSAMRNGPVFTCRLLSLLLQVDWHGRVYVPCPRYEHAKARIAGNITQRSLREVWLSQEARSLRREGASCKPAVDCMSACVHDISVLAGLNAGMLLEQAVSEASVGRTLARKLL